MSLVVEALALNQLTPGVLSLGVPVADGAVQIGTINLDRKARLAVTIDPPQVTIAREDGSLLQINGISAYSESVSWGRASAFVRPVTEIVLKNMREYGLWMVDKTEGLVINDSDILRSFISHIGTYAQRKQIRQLE